MLGWKKKSTSGKFTAPPDDSIFEDDFQLSSARTDVSKPLVHTFGPGNAHPMGIDDESAIIPRQMYLNLLEKADQAEKLNALVADAIDRKAILHSLLDSPAGPTNIASRLQLALTNANDDLTSCYSMQADAGASDMLQPLRRSLTELALTTKRLELRFAISDMGAAIQQQQSLEKLAIEAEYFGRHHWQPYDPVTLAEVSAEVEVLAKRLAVVQARAEKGIIPLCDISLGLGDDVAASHPHAATDPAFRAVHANLETDTFAPLEVAMGYTMHGHIAHTLQHMVDVCGQLTINAVDLARATWSRCDAHYKIRLGSEPDASMSQPATLLRRWIQYTKSQAFYTEQVDTLKFLQEYARKKQAETRCCQGTHSRHRGSTFATSSDAISVQPTSLERHDATLARQPAEPPAIKSFAPTTPVPSRTPRKQSSTSSLSSASGFQSTGARSTALSKTHSNRDGATSKAPSRASPPTPTSSPTRSLSKSSISGCPASSRSARTPLRDVSNKPIWK